MVTANMLCRQGEEVTSLQFGSWERLKEQKESYLQEMRHKHKLWQSEQEYFMASNSLPKLDRRKNSNRRSRRCPLERQNSIEKSVNSVAGACRKERKPSTNHRHQHRRASSLSTLLPLRPNSRPSLASIQQHYVDHKLSNTPAAASAATSLPRVSIKDILSESMNSLDIESDGSFGVGSDAEGIHKDDTEAFDRGMFFRMPHPLDCKGGTLGANMDSLWEVQSALKDLKRYLRCKGNDQVTHYIPCKDPNSVSLKRVFAWLASLTYSLKMASKPSSHNHTAVKSSKKELGAFVKGITPEMIGRILAFVDIDANGEIDIGELDTAFRLSRWEIDEVFEVLPNDDEEEHDDFGGSGIRKHSLPYAALDHPNDTTLCSLRTPANATKGGGGSSSIAATAIIPSLLSTSSSAIPSSSPRAAATFSTDEYPFFAEIDIANVVYFFQPDGYGIIDIGKSVRNIRALRSTKCKTLPKEIILVAYFAIICEGLLSRMQTPVDWINEAFGDGVDVVGSLQLQIGLTELLQDRAPHAFFGPYYRLFEAYSEDMTTGNKGQVNVNALQQYLDDMINKIVRQRKSLQDTTSTPSVSGGSMKKDLTAEPTSFMRESIERIESVVLGRYCLRLSEYLKFLDTERSGRLTTVKLLSCLRNLARMTPPDQVAKKLLMDKQEKMRKLENERRRKHRVFLNRLIKMKNMGVTDVLRKFEGFMRDRGMRLQDFFNLVDEDRSGRLTPDELVQALTLFANRPENPIRTFEKERREQILARKKHEIDKLAEEQLHWTRRMRDLEHSGAHKGLLKMNKYMRKYQVTIDQVFAPLHEGDSSTTTSRVVTKDQLLKAFREERLTGEDIGRLLEFMHGRITTQRLKHIMFQYARYKRLLKHLTVRTEEDAGLQLFSYETVLKILRYFYWQESGPSSSSLDKSLDLSEDPVELRISLVDLQNAVDNADKKHIICYAKDFRMKRFGSPHRAPSSSAASAAEGRGGRRI